MTHGATRRHLGATCACAVLDLQSEFDADALGRIEGTILGDGALVLRCRPLSGWNTRFERRFQRALARHTSSDDRAGEPVLRATRGTADQARVVRRLRHSLRAPVRIVVTADRGRGKSAALGIVLAEVEPERRVVISGPSEQACAGIRRFGGERGAAAPFVHPAELAAAPHPADVIFVDEAAQLPVPVLRRLVANHAEAAIVFATTVHGYEGTGRGFTLRFVEGLRADPVPLVELSMREPIRWDDGDPVEAFVRDALLLDAEPHDVDASADITGLVCEELDRDALVEDDALLRGVFGLLVQAHYRTTPRDLQHLLDAPNVDVHVARLGCAVVGVNVVALEGGLDAATVDDMFHGRGSVVGQALPETLVSHLGYRECGALRYVRSVRIATHPALRRRGIATRLTEHVHASYSPDAFGTIHGATADVLRFRRALGYELVRVSASRGSRTGEPAVTLLRPHTPEASATFHALRADLGRDLPTQLRLFEAGGELLLDPDLRRALTEGLGETRAGSWRPDRVLAYALGPRTFESVAVDVQAFVAEHASFFTSLSAQDVALLRARVVEERPWTQTMAEARTDTLPATMRGLRRAFRRLVEAARPDLVSGDRS